VRAFAERLGLEDAAVLLQQTLDEEGETDKQLTDIAEALELVTGELTAGVGTGRSRQ
jgi:ferritin-like metal-binding protein YciE